MLSLYSTFPGRACELDGSSPFGGTATISNVAARVKLGRSCLQESFFNAIFGASTGSVRANADRTVHLPGECPVS